MIHNPKCYAQHLGLWAIEPQWFSAAVASVRAGTWPVRSDAEIQAEMKRQDESPLFEVTKDGIAIVAISGPMMKGQSKYGGTSTLRTRQALREAANDDGVKGIILHVDSPGGTVAGTADLARDVQRSAERKRVYAHIDDLGASAAYWAASQATRVFAGPSSEIGSIGTVAIVRDTSGAAEMAGIKVHIVSTGNFKGAFTDGASVSEEDLQYLQQRVEDLNVHFLRAVMDGRKMDPERVSAVADGRVFIASRAKKMGLIDGVQDFDATVALMTEKIQARQRAKSIEARIQESRLSVS